MQILKWTIAILLCLTVYCIPAGIAVAREHKNMAAIIVVNILLGWTLIGWVAALAWSVTNQT